MYVAQCGHVANAKMAMDDIEWEMEHELLLCHCKYAFTMGKGLAKRWKDGMPSDSIQHFIL